MIDRSQWVFCLARLRMLDDRRRAIDAGHAITHPREDSHQTSIAASDVEDFASADLADHFHDPGIDQRAMPQVAFVALIFVEPIRKRRPFASLHETFL